MTISDSLKTLFSATSVLHTYFLKIAVVFLILLIGFIAARMLGKIVRKLFVQLKISEIITKSDIKIGIGFIVGTSLEWGTYLVSIIIALNEFGLSKATVNIIVLSIIIISVISLITITLLGINGFAPNFIAGIYIQFLNRIKKGMIIQINSHKGEVIKVGLLEIKLKTKTDEIIFIPNSKIFSNELVIQEHKKD